MTKTTVERLLDKPLDPAVHKVRPIIGTPLTGPLNDLATLQMLLRLREQGHMHVVHRRHRKEREEDGWTRWDPNIANRARAFITMASAAAYAEDLATGAYYPWEYILKPRGYDNLLNADAKNRPNQVAVFALPLDDFIVRMELSDERERSNDVAKSAYRNYLYETNQRPR